MAIYKVMSARGTGTHGALRNCLHYVLQPNKTDDDTLCYIQGPYDGGPVEPDMVYASFLSLKAEHDKDTGRQYFHTVISFPPDEKITPEQALEYGINFSEQAYKGYQVCIAVHNEKDKNLHLHFVINSVGIEGKKFKLNKEKLKADKELNDGLCKEYGLSITRKGFHADGTPMSEGDIISYDKDKYRAIINSDENKPSYLVDCGIAVMTAIQKARSKDEFISEMEQQGYSVKWSDNRKHITFTNSDGKKVRDSNLQKNFNLPVSKELIEREVKKNELERKAEKARRAEAGRLEREFSSQRRKRPDEDNDKRIKRSGRGRSK